MSKLSLDNLNPVADRDGLRLGMPYVFVHQGIPYYQTHSSGHEWRKNKFGTMSVACDRFARYAPHKPAVQDRFWLAESTGPDWRPFLIDFRIVPFYYKDQSEITIAHPAVRDVVLGLCNYLNRMCELYGEDRLLTLEEAHERIDQCWRGERQTLTLQRRINLIHGKTNGK